MSFLEQFPNREVLLEAYDKASSGFPMKVNNHIHTPYSFSAFESVTKAVRTAVAEEVRVLGINDFYVTDGYGEFMEECVDHGLFPLFNIELIGISEADQEAGIRVNDPGNPGRTYISGKGLAYPSIQSESNEKILQSVVEESNKQVSQMIELLNGWLEKQGVSFRLSVEEIMEKLAVNLLRERHVAKMVRLKLEEHASGDQEYAEILSKVYGGLASTKSRSDIAGIEDELRSKLLKSGAPAFVPEDVKAFLPLEEIVSIIRDAGGIPTYPMLLDGAGDQMTEFEGDKEKLLKVLQSRGFNSIEFIPLRNQIDILKEYAEFFYENGFMISFGTEHNTTAMVPVEVSAKGQVALDDSLLQISFNGAACQAAHQYLVEREGANYKQGSRDEMEQLGSAIFFHYFRNYNPSLTDN
ncbi:MAG: hypothetical protein GY790_14440 [Bacteroidetes bacterium]|nr:hypothetical protein [Bacteroidota bacterium]